MDDVELRLIDPMRNRFRVYGMTECRTLFGEVCLFIAWGRVGRPLRTRTEAFEDPRALEARRRRRGYVASSEPTPVIAAMRPSPVRPVSSPTRQTRLPFVGP